jgi:squalene cyclase
MSNVAEFLLRAQNPDGGWGYRVGGMSYVEPTSTVLLALNNAHARTRGRDFLLSLQHVDGGWGIAASDSESGWMTAWAVRALAELPDTHAAIRRGANWLIRNAGLVIRDESARAKIKQLFKIDSTLRGWPWQPGDAAWVQPTALTLLALVAAAQSDHPRVREGVQYLFDRACPDGGWNIGNPWMLDKQIPSTIQDTAVALLALRAVGESSNDARIATAIRFLREAVARAHTAAELAWGIYALQSWEVEVSEAVLQRLNALQRADGSWDSNPFMTAIAMLALKT